MTLVRSSNPRHLPHAARSGAVIAAVPAILLGAGCTGNLNSSDDLIGVDPVVAERSATDMAQGTGAPASDQPSLQGLDRRNWPVQTIVSPPSQVQFNPTYVEPVLVDNTTARQRGEYPRFDTMLEETGTADRLAWQAVGTIPYNGWLLLISPVRMIMTPPSTVERGPGGYQRMPPASTLDPWAWVTPPGAMPSAPPTSVPTATTPTTD